MNTAQETIATFGDGDPLEVFPTKPSPMFLRIAEAEIVHLLDRNACTVCRMDHELRDYGHTLINVILSQKDQIPESWRKFRLIFPGTSARRDQTNQFLLVHTMYWGPPNNEKGQPDWHESTDSWTDLAYPICEYAMVREKRSPVPPEITS